MEQLSQSQQSSSQSSSVSPGSSSPTVSKRQIRYPPGCKPVTCGMPEDVLITRLKAISLVFEGTQQDEADRFRAYKPLCRHLATDGFLSHRSLEVRLLIACCIVQILRIYAPEAPYKDPVQIKEIFNFLIDQLQGIRDVNDSAYPRYSNILETLATVKSFNMCLDLPDNDDIMCSVFTLFFTVIRDEHSLKVKTYMRGILTDLVTPGNVSYDMLNAILVNLLEPVKSRKAAFCLTKELITECSEILQPYIEAFISNAMLSENVNDENADSQHLRSSFKIYDVFYELYHTWPSMLQTSIGHLELKLKSQNENDRQKAVCLLARMFSEKGSTLAVEQAQLWQAFVGRFNDISVNIRIKCVQSSMHFLVNHPTLRSGIVEALRIRQHDHHEVVRLEVVKAIVATVGYDFDTVLKSEDLLNYVMGRTLDKKFKIRREALLGLAIIYKKCIEETPPKISPAMSSIQNRVLHGYYLTEVEDRMLIENIFNKSLVPYTLEPKDRMEKLLYLFSTIDDNAIKAFTEINKSMVLICRHVRELMRVVNSRGTIDEEEFTPELNRCVSILTKSFPQPGIASEFIMKFTKKLMEDSNMMQAMENIVSTEATCKTRVKSMMIVFKKLGSPVMTNVYFKTIKLLVERISSVLIDDDAIFHLVSLTENIVKKKSNFMKRYNVSFDVAVTKGMKLIEVLSFLFAPNFNDEKVIQILINMLNNDKLSSEHKSGVLAALVCTGLNRPLGRHHPDILTKLARLCEKLVVDGSPRQGKLATRCLFVNLNEAERKNTFAPILETLRANLNPTSKKYIACITSLGQIANLMPDVFRADMRTIVSQKIIKELIMNPCRVNVDEQTTRSEEWCEKEALPEITKCMIAGMKCTVRWLLGLKSDHQSAAKAFKMLSAFVENGGTFLNSGVKFSPAENAWLRLAGGCAMLKLCEQKGVGDQFTALQFLTLSKLMNDDELQVRTRFANRLNKGLSRGIPNKCLPLDFMGFYALAGKEPDKKLKQMLKSHVTSNVNRRRDYINKFILRLQMGDEAGDQISNIIPEYILLFAVPILTHDSSVISHDDHEQLQTIANCVSFILEPLLVNDDGHTYVFYRKCFRRLKLYKNAVEPDDADMNVRMYAVCDIIMALLQKSITSIDAGDSPIEPRIPLMYFVRHGESNYNNDRCYLPPDFQLGSPSKTNRKASQAQAPKGKGKQNMKDVVPAIDEHGNVSIDAHPPVASGAVMHIPEIHSGSGVAESERMADSEELTTQESNTKSATDSETDGLVGVPEQGHVGRGSGKRQNHKAVKQIEEEQTRNMRSRKRAANKSADNNLTTASMPQDSPDVVPTRKSARLTNKYEAIYTSQ